MARRGGKERIRWNRQKKTSVLLSTGLHEKKKEISKEERRNRAKVQKKIDTMRKEPAVCEEGPNKDAMYKKKKKKKKAGRRERSRAKHARRHVKGKILRCTSPSKFLRLGHSQKKKKGGSH